MHLSAPASDARLNLRNKVCIEASSFLDESSMPWSSLSIYAVFITAETYWNDRISSARFYWSSFKSLSTDQWGRKEKYVSSKIIRSTSLISDVLFRKVCPMQFISNTICGWDQHGRVDHLHNLLHCWTWHLLLKHVVAHRWWCDHSSLVLTHWNWPIVEHFVH